MNQPEMNSTRWGDAFSNTTVEWKDLDKRKYYLFGPSTFILVRGFVYPFSLIKTRLFMQKKKAMYKGTFDAFKQVLRHEGVRGLYKGFLPSTITLISGQFYITTYEVTRSLMEGYGSGVRSFCGGLVASLVGQSITVPIDIVSQHMMVQGQVGRDSVDKKKIRLKGSIAITRDILRSEGIIGLYRGYLVSLLTYAPSSAVWWWAYSQFLTQAVDCRLGEYLPRYLIIMGSGSCAALVSSTSTNIMDLVRTRYQLENSQSLRECVKRLWREERWSVFHKGLSARIIQNAPTSAIMIIGYETVKRLSIKS